MDFKYKIADVAKEFGVPTKKVIETVFEEDNLIQHFFNIADQMGGEHERGVLAVVMQDGV